MGASKIIDRKGYQVVARRSAEASYASITVRDITAEEYRREYGGDPPSKGFWCKSSITTIDIIGNETELFTVFLINHELGHEVMYPRSDSTASFIQKYLETVEGSPRNTPIHVVLNILYDIIVNNERLNNQRINNFFPEYFLSEMLRIYDIEGGKKENFHDDDINAFNLLYRVMLDNARIYMKKEPIYCKALDAHLPNPYVTRILHDSSTIIRQNVRDGIKTLRRMYKNYLLFDRRIKAPKAKDGGGGGGGGKGGKPPKGGGGEQAGGGGANDEIMGEVLSEILKEILRSDYHWNDTMTEKGGEIAKKYYKGEG